MRYTKYSNYLMINLLYFVVLLLIATAPLRTWEKPLKLIIEIIISNLHAPGLLTIDKTDTKATDKNEKTVKNDIKTNELNLNTKKLSKVNIAQIDRKLDYLFGKAMGREHNIHRTKSMQISLKHIGVYDNKAGRNALINHFEKVFNDPTSIVETKMKTFTYNELPDKPLGHYISTTRESFFMGPGGGVLFESVWKGNELESVIIRRGKY